MSFWRDHAAVGQTFAFLVAGAVFVAAIGAILLASRNGGQDRMGAGWASDEAQARSLADTLVSSPGVGWSLGPDHVQRLGLSAANGSLDPAALDALRGALFASAANGKVDYPDGRASLAIAGTQDFHLRIYPAALPAVYWEVKKGIHTAYVGDWVSLATVVVPSGAPGVVEAGAQAQLNLTMFGATASERLALRELGLQFNDRVFVSSTAPTILVTVTNPPSTPSILQYLNVPLLEGDVYPDVKSYLNDNLPGRLAGYDMLVVGSGVDQSTLTSASVKYAIRDWVLAGGTLVVLGSAALNYQWLEPLFSVGVHTANGSPTAPDPSHPLLATPNVLQWTLYDDHAMGWDIKNTGSNAAYNSFSHVIVQAGQDALAVSKDGGFGAGRIVLTTYLPREMAAAPNLGQAEAEHFLDNIILFSDRSDLYLEYGPEQPPDSAVAVAVRTTTQWDDKLGMVPEVVEVHLWGEPA
jgi:hypothetical protein